MIPFIPLISLYILKVDYLLLLYILYFRNGICCKWRDTIHVDIILIASNIVAHLKAKNIIVDKLIESEIRDALPEYGVFLKLDKFGKLAVTTCVIKLCQDEKLQPPAAPSWILL